MRSVVFRPLGGCRAAQGGIVARFRPMDDVCVVLAVTLASTWAAIIFVAVKQRCVRGCVGRCQVAAPGWRALAWMLLPAVCAPGVASRSGHRVLRRFPSLLAEHNCASDCAAWEHTRRGNRGDCRTSRAASPARSRQTVARPAAHKPTPLLVFVVRRVSRPRRDCAPLHFMWWCVRGGPLPTRAFGRETLAVPWRPHHAVSAPVHACLDRPLRASLLHAASASSCCAFYGRVCVV
jgi:hypothetical protein